MSGFRFSVHTRVSVVNKEAGIRADGSLSRGSIVVTIDDSLISHNNFAGIAVFTPVGGGVAQIWVNRWTSSLNGFGLHANVAGATLRIGNSVVTGNATGVKIAKSAIMTSFGTNHIFDDTVSGATVAVVGLN